MDVVHTQDMGSAGKHAVGTAMGAHRGRAVLHGTVLLMSALFAGNVSAAAPEANSQPLTVKLAPAVLADYTGTYRLDARVPNDLVGNLAGHFESGTLEVGITDGAMTATENKKQPMTLQPLTPTRFVGPVEILQLRFEFLRNAKGAVYAMVVERGNAKVYFRRDAGQVVTQ